MRNRRVFPIPEEVLPYKVGDNPKGYVVDQNENSYVVAGA